MAQNLNNVEGGFVSLHIAMFPWFALGHITPYLHISNKLAQKGHKISFFVPTKTQSKVQHFNRFPNLITFVPIFVPHVEGLPLGAETTSDVPKPLFSLIATAMDQSAPQVEHLFRSLKPQLVFHDLAHWIPKLARQFGIKSLSFFIINASTIGYNLRPDMKLGEDKMTLADQMHPPEGFPDPSFKLSLHVARDYVKRRQKTFGSDVLFFNRIYISFAECDAIAFKGCREIDGPFTDYVSKLFNKAVLHAGLVIPEPSSSILDEKCDAWLKRFEPESVIFCCLGSEWILEKAQFHELLLGLELSGLPFLAALKPPFGAETVEEAFPEGFVERVGDRGVVQSGWIQQQLILSHPSVGCFVTHGGSSSITEGIVNSCQLVMIPHEGDHFFQARMISNTHKAGIEVERSEEDGFFSAESVSKAIETVMEKGDHCNEFGREIRANLAKLQKLYSITDLEAKCIDEFNLNLQSLVFTAAK